MIINCHAGHNPDGKVANGAVGLIKESTEARKVKDEVIRLLRKEGHTVFDCTVDNGTSQNDVLKKIVNKCNQNKVDLDISIHFNAGANDLKGNGRGCGTEVFVYKIGNSSTNYAKNIVENISKLGFKNRGVKEDKNLYILKNTKSPSLLIECLFVDDKDDVNLYDYKTMAKAIVEGILNKSLDTKDTKYGVDINYFDTRDKAVEFSNKLTNDYNAYNEIYEKDGKFGIKVSTFDTLESATNFKNTLQTKYNAYYNIYSI